MHTVMAQNLGLFGNITLEGGGRMATDSEVEEMLSTFLR